MLRLLCPFFFLLVLASAPRAAPPPPDNIRGGKVEWTRLRTADKYWDRHSNGDVALLQLMRANTSLNIAQEWRATRADSLGALCVSPFVYAADVSPLSANEG